MQSVIEPLPVTKVAFHQMFHFYGNISGFEISPKLFLEDARNVTIAISSRHMQSDVVIGRHDLDNFNQYLWHAPPFVEPSPVCHGGEMVSRARQGRAACDVIDKGKTGTHTFCNHLAWDLEHN